MVFVGALDDFLEACPACEVWGKFVGWRDETSSKFRGPLEPLLKSERLDEGVEQLLDELLPRRCW